MTCLTIKMMKIRLFKNKEVILGINNNFFKDKHILFKREEYF